MSATMTLRRRCLLFASGALTVIGIEWVGARQYFWGSIQDATRVTQDSTSVPASAPLLRRDAELVELVAATAEPTQSPEPATTTAAATTATVPPTTSTASTAQATTPAKAKRRPSWRDWRSLLRGAGQKADEPVAYDDSCRGAVSDKVAGLAHRIRHFDFEQAWGGRPPKQPWGLPARIGCAALCVLPASVVPRDSNSLQCVEFGDASAAQAPSFVNEQCGWAPQMDPYRKWRAMVNVRFVAAAYERGMRGIALVETHDSTHTTRDMAEKLWQLGIPVLTMSHAPKGHAVRAGDDLNDPSRRGLVLMPDLYFTTTQGYTSSLIDAIGNASALHPWESKKRQVAFRGSSTGCPPRDASQLHVNQRISLSVHAGEKREDPAQRDMWDVGIAGICQINWDIEPLLRRKGAIRDKLDYAGMIASKAIFDVDGNSNSWEGCFWKLLSNSVVLKVDGTHEQWYYSLLEPWKHYVPVAHDLSDVDERVQYVLDPANDAQMREIADRGTALARSLTYQGEVERLRGVLRLAMVVPPLASSASEEEAALYEELDAELEADAGLREALASRVVCTSGRPMLTNRIHEVC